MTTLAQDTLLGDRYRLARRIAVGGMGEVWQAEDRLLHRTVAVKALKSELASDPKFLERFRAEARTAAALSHPGIAPVFDYGEAALDGSAGPETPYLVMELVDGEPLSAILARSGRLPVSRTLDLLGQAAAALDVAHRAGMVHRDVKPGNLLVRPDGMVKLTDFGIARAADAVPLTQSGMVVGTAQYFSPEQAQGRAVTAASDVYSLGVVAYECLAGRPPFVADSAVAVALKQINEVPPPLPAEIPTPVRALVARMLAKDPRARFGTAGELAGAVRAVQQGRYDDPVAFAALAPPGPPPPAGMLAATPTRVMPVGPPPPGAGVGPPPSRPGAGRRRAARWSPLVAAALVFALVVAGGLIVLLSQRGSSGSGTGPSTTSSSGSSSGPNAETSAGTDQPSPSPTNSSITLDKGDYIGRSVTKVTDQLRAQQLVPVVQAAPDGQDGQPGEVIDLVWQGELRPGSEIIVIAIPGRGRGKTR